MSESLARLQKNTPTAPLDLETAKAISAQARTGALGIPKLIQNAMKEVRPDV